MTNTTISSIVPNRVSKEEQEQIDRLSNLPEHLLLLILSLLPTPVAARTSLISRSFRQIWEATHLNEICSRHYYRNKDDCGIVRFDSSSYPLLPLNLHSCYDMTIDCFAFLLRKARSLGLRHLKVSLCRDEHLEYIFPFICTFDNLLSLSFGGSYRYFGRVVLRPSNVSLTHLQSLSLCLADWDCDMLNEVLSRLCSLEELFIELMDTDVFNLMSQTVRKLELTSKRIHRQCVKMLKLSMPNLEILRVRIDDWMPHFWGEIPKLRNAFLSTDLVCQSNVPAICDFLKNVINVETLKLDLRECGLEMHPFHMVLDPACEPPIFPNLKSLDLNLCFHDENMKDLISLLQNCPVLESLNLIHNKGPKRPRKHMSRSMFRLRLPRNADGNYQHACFRDLHIEEKKKQLIELLLRK